MSRFETVLSSEINVLFIVISMDSEVDSSGIVKLINLEKKTL